ncbi:MAG: GNAT family N-acetyltransferase [Theionarchaea archaeon]|nr:GNAT family N-acetyltransferase [Theionarchaea archaeon]
MNYPANTSPLSVSVHTSIENVDHMQWNEVVGNDLFHTIDWLKLLEVSLPEEVNPFYITVYRGSVLVGAGICYNTIERQFKIPIPVIICTFPLFEEMALFTRIPQDREVFSVLIDTLESIARNCKVHTLLITKSPSGFYGEILKEKGYHHLHLMPTTYLDITWDTFQDYLKSLPRKAKKNIRHTLNQGKKRGLRLVHSQDLSDIEYLYELFRATLDRYGHQNLIPFQLEVFKNLTTYVKEYTYVIRCYHGEELLGYWMYFFDGNIASLAISGMDQSRAPAYNTYFNVCYDTIREMIERGCERAWFGLSTYEVKRRIGCKLKTNIISIKTRNPLLNIAVKLIIALRNIQIARRYQYEKDLLKD